MRNEGRLARRSTMFDRGVIEASIGLRRRIHGFRGPHLIRRAPTQAVASHWSGAAPRGFLPASRYIAL